MSKFIFVTGGVVSGLGKGITAASLGRLLKCRGLKVTSQKLDPYMNVDPGTMSPFQHGEVFVTDDGAETDLDLGHYERFIDENLTKYSNMTSGRVYWNVLNKERQGEYLGQTVQIIPHVTNEIKDFVMKNAEVSNADVSIVEVGGTIGDIESQPFLEAIRQLALEVGRRNCLFIHVCLVPYISGSDEFKSKPTQHSVKELMAVGIHPDIIVARCDNEIPVDIRKKISLFCNVGEDCVINNTTCKSLYEVPLMLHAQNMDDVVCRDLGLENKADYPALSDWSRMVETIHARQGELQIALVGKYVKLHDSYLSIVESLNHASFVVGKNVKIKWVDSDSVTDDTVVYGINLSDAYAEFEMGGITSVMGETQFLENVGTPAYVRLTPDDFQRSDYIFLDENGNAYRFIFYQYIDSDEDPILTYVIWGTPEYWQDWTIMEG